MSSRSPQLPGGQAVLRVYLLQHARFSEPADPSVHYVPWQRWQLRGVLLFLSLPEPTLYSSSTTSSFLPGVKSCITGLRSQINKLLPNFVCPTPCSTRRSSPMSVHLSCWTHWPWPAIPWCPFLTSLAGPGASCQVAEQALSNSTVATAAKGQAQSRAWWACLTGKAPMSLFLD